MPQDENASSPRKPTKLEKEESWLWRVALLLIILFAAGTAVLSWERLQSLPYQLWAIPVGMMALAVLFAVYAYGRRREVSELKVLLHDLQDRVGVVPSEEQLEKGYVFDLAGSLTIVVGPKNSGKTIVLNAVQLFCQTVKYGSGDYSLIHAKEPFRLENDMFDVSLQGIFIVYYHK